MADNRNKFLARVNILHHLQISLLLTKNKVCKEFIVFKFHFTRMLSSFFLHEVTSKSSWKRELELHSQQLSGAKTFSWGRCIPLLVLYCTPMSCAFNFKKKSKIIVFQLSYLVWWLSPTFSNDYHRIDCIWKLFFKCQ